MRTNMNLISRIDALLPQTQCGKCGHNGCRPYASALAAGAEPINKCPPGGTETLAALAHLLHTPVIPLDLARGRGPAVVAFIREAECIGCTKCIQACPVDAIVGAARLMHSVLSDECTGCDLCVAPCPVDCIDLLPLTPPTPMIGPLADVVPMVGGLAHDPATFTRRQAKRDRARQRFERRNERLRHAELQRQAQRAARQAAAPGAPAAVAVPAPSEQDADKALKQAKIAVAMSRAQFNKSIRAFGSPPTAEQHALLSQLHQQVEAAEALLLRLQPPAEETRAP